MSFVSAQNSGTSTLFITLLSGVSFIDWKSNQIQQYEQVINRDFNF